MRVSLPEIVDVLEEQYDEHLCFVDRQTGQVELVQREVLSLAEEGGDVEELPKWQQPQFEIANALIADPDRFERLPTKHDVHDWEIMREFAESVDPEWLSDELLNAIHGSGAFRYFKDTLQRHRREKDWYAYRTEALRQIALEWCKEHGIEYTDRRPDTID